MPTLHALLVGINHYPDPRHTLRGCVNDVQHLHKYLEAYCSSMGFVYRPLILTDTAATRQGVIDGFGYFQAAAASDCCLFHFSGHGSRSLAPEAFWELEPDHSLESIVCWDSRESGGHDLMDKELSYLIWRAGEGTDLPFVTVMDCCHSGRMKDAKEEEIFGVRTLHDMGDPLPAEQFLGIGYYKKTSGGQLSPPLGRRIHLAAARDTELAKEVNAGGQPRGIFTYCLIEALNAVGPIISYADLLNRVNLRIRNAVADQSAQLDATFTEDRNRGFLFSRVDAERPAYLIAWDKKMNAWMLNAGALHGIPAVDTDARTELELSDEGHIVTIEKVLPNCSRVSGMDGYDTKRAYAAEMRRRAKPKLALAFAPGSDPEGVSILLDYNQRHSSGMFEFSDTIWKNDFLVHAREGAYFLSRSHDFTPLFQRTTGYTEASAADFLKKLDKVANWQQLLDLNNPGTNIGYSEIEIELYRVTEPGNETDDAPVERVDWQAGPAVYTYTNATIKPAFQLKLRNTGHRPIWVSMLYLGNDFSITNQLLPKVLLGSGQEMWVQEIFKGQTYRTIPLRIDEIFHRQGITAVDEYMKILHSTEELNTDMYYQKGLTADVESTRLAGRGDAITGSDWAAKTVWVRVEKLP